MNTKSKDGCAAHMECAGRAKRRRRFGCARGRLGAGSPAEAKRRRRFALPAHSKSLFAEGGAPHELRLLTGLVCCFLIFGTVATPASAQPSAKVQISHLVTVLKSDAGQKEKADACRELARIGTKQAVPDLAALLGDE